MIKLQIVVGSLQVSSNGNIILVAPKNSCAIDVLALYDDIPMVVIYNKYLGNSTVIFTQPLANCVDSNSIPFDVDSFILFAELNLGFDTYGGGCGGGGCNSPFEYNANGYYGIQPIYGSSVTTGQFSTIGGGDGNINSGIGSVISGGFTNTVTNNYSVIGGGFRNINSGISSSIVGGKSNCTTNNYSFIGGGCINRACGCGSIVVGGFLNRACCTNNFIGGGSANVTNCLNSFVGGGASNNALNNHSSIVGGCRNSACGTYSFMGGGKRNRVGYEADSSVTVGGYCNKTLGKFSSIVGGCNNNNCGAYSFIGGGRTNTILNTGSFSSIGGGCLNRTSNLYSTISGGFCNINTGQFSTIGGGNQNTASSYFSFIGSGARNISSCNASVVVGGAYNTASSFYSSISGGRNNTASNRYATIGGGLFNVASGCNSSILGGVCNNTCTFTDAMIIGSNLCATQSCTTFMNCASANNLTVGCLVCVGANKVLENLPVSTRVLNYGLFSQTANSTPVTATTVAGTLLGTGIGSLSVPANTFLAGDSFTGNMSGIMSSKNNDSIIISVTSGSVILAQSTAFSLPAITNQVWSLSLDFTIRTIGGTGVASIVTFGQMHVLKLASGTQEGFGFNSINTTTFDTTISNTLSVTAQWSSNSALNSIYTDIFVLTKIF